MDEITIEELIRRYIHLPNATSGTGWYHILCKVCNDHGKKGPRAGFKFEDGTAGYHCFNCGIKSTYNPDTYDHFPRKMEQIFDAYGIPEEEVQRLQFQAMKRRDEGGSLREEQQKAVVKITPEKIPLPDHFYRLSDAEPDDKWAEIANYYLEDRNIDPESYPFYLSTGIPSSYDGPEIGRKIFVKQAQKWKGRVIYPVYKDDNLIFYQGRDLTGKALKKYESPSVSRERVLFGFDQLFNGETAPLYVCEGFFDAFPINGVGIMGNRLSEAQIIWLNKSSRDKVYIPDKFGDGAENALAALKLGWKISLPDVGNCKDISDAIVKYGKIFVHNTLREQTMEGFQAESAINLYCKK